jgi:hypothetical protein
MNPNPDFGKTPTVLIVTEIWAGKRCWIEAFCVEVDRYPLNLEDASKSLRLCFGRKTRSFDYVCTGTCGLFASTRGSSAANSG